MFYLQRRPGSAGPSRYLRFGVLVFEFDMLPFWIGVLGFAFLAVCLVLGSK